MPVSPPPPPPPPPKSIKSPIPNSNKHLLQSIEAGTKLKRVPDSAKNDRSSGLVAAGITSPSNNNADRRFSQNQGSNVMPKPVMNNGSNDLQNQLMNQLSSMRLGANNFQEKRTSIPSNNNTRPTPNPPVTKHPPYVPLLINKAPSLPGSNMTQLSSGLITRTSVTDNLPLTNSTIKAPLLPYNQNSSVTSRPSPPAIASNKPLLPKPYQPQIANKPTPNPPTETVLRATTASYNQSVNNWNPSANQFQGNDNRFSPSNQIQSISNRAPAANQIQANNNRASPVNQLQANTSKVPAANQFQSISNRAPPPPPSTNKPIHRNSASMDPMASLPVTPPNIIDPVVRQRPWSQAPSIDSNARQSSVTRTTNNPPPPVPGPFRFPEQRPSSSAPPLPSRVSIQSESSTATSRSLLQDRPPPPVPPSQPATVRSSQTSGLSAFDRRFKFPNPNSFPPL